RGYFKPLNKNLPAMPDSQTILTTKNDSKITIGEEAELNQVTVEQNGLRVFSNEAYLRLDNNNRMEVLELMARSKYQNDKLLIWASSGVLNIKQNQTRLNRVTYRIQVENGNIWGQAKSVSRDDKHRYYFHEPTMSFCPPNGNVWSIKAKTLVYDPNKHLIILEGAALLNYDYTLVSLPYLNFATEGRKSGFLKPDIEWTPYGGTAIFVPYYFNLASNMDLVLSPAVFTKRGVGLSSHYRYLTHAGEGDLMFLGLLDQDKDTSRYQILWKNETLLRPDLSLSINLSKFSDTDIFKDFGNYFDLLDTLHPVELARLSWVPTWGVVDFGVSNFQNEFVEESGTLADVHYVSIDPQQLYLTRNLIFKPEIGYAHYSDVAQSNRGDFGSSIDRGVVNMDFSYDFRKPYVFLRPSIGSTFRWYHSDGKKSSDDNIPYLKLVTGLNFERFQPGLHQTLVPQISYLYTPYKDQTNLPILNSSVAATNDISTLYEAKRFLGVDRIEDNNALILGFSSRAQFKEYYWDFSAGQQINLKSPRVCLYSDCQDVVGGSADYSPLFFNVSGTYPSANVNTHLAYDTDLNMLRSLGSKLQLKTEMSDTVGIDYEYDARRGGDDNQIITELSRVGMHAEYRISPRYVIKPAVFHDFKSNVTTSYEIINVFKSCCWSSELKLGRRYTGASTGDPDSYQWFASFMFHLDGFTR
ncbi:MAG: hypothetical protein CMF41_00125, partial [Legionellales bacterium]|nr:hypothetical protein [Legionellales bacterium]